MIIILRRQSVYEKSQLTGRFFAFVAATTTGAIFVVVVAVAVVPAAVPVPVEDVEVELAAAPPVFV